MNYEIRPYWDTHLAIVFKLGNVSDITLTGLVYEAIQTVTGSPVATANKFTKGCQILNIFDGTWYENTGTTASPVWSLVPGGGTGLTQLTGDVTAGPGTGSQVATIANGAVTGAKMAALTSGHLLVGSAGNVATSVAMSGDATIIASGALTIANNAITTAKIANNAVDGTKIALTSQATGSIMYYNGTDWVVLLAGTVGQVLTMGASIPGWA